MNQSIGIILCWGFLCSVLLFIRIPWVSVSANSEGDALNAFKTSLHDPRNVLHNWDPTLPNPCKWMQVTCNGDNSVIRLDLGDMNLSGQLVPELGLLPNLQYLELYSNNMTGGIPPHLGNLTNLVSLELYLNKLSGHIPDTLGNLGKLRVLRLNSNNLTGEIPMSLTKIATLAVFNLSGNQITGNIPVNGSFQLFTPGSFDNNHLDPITVSPPSVVPPTSQSPRDGNTIVGAIAAGAALIFLHLQ